MKIKLSLQFFNAFFSVENFLSVFGSSLALALPATGRVAVGCGGLRDTECDSDFPILYSGLLPRGKNMLFGFNATVIARGSYRSSPCIGLYTGGTTRGDCRPEVVR